MGAGAREEAEAVSEGYPTPGSDLAIEHGCRCPVLDNAHGKGWMGGRTDANGKVQYVISELCPIHGNEGDAT